MIFQIKDDVSLISDIFKGCTAKPAIIFFKDNVCI